MPNKNEGVDRNRYPKSRGKGKTKNARQGHKDKRQEEKKQSDFVLISESDDNSDGDTFNNQVQQLQISPIAARDPSSSRMNTPQWGAAASGSGMDRIRQTRHAESLQHEGKAISLPGPPSLSGFLQFSDSRGTPTAPRSEAFAQLMGQQQRHTPTQQQQQQRHTPSRRTPSGPQVPDLLQQMAIGGDGSADNSLLFARSTSQTSGNRNQSMPPATPSSAMVRPPKPSFVEKEFPPVKAKGGHPAGTKIVRDKQTISIQKCHSRGPLSVDEVNASIKECIEIMADAGEHVSVERIEAMILQKYQVRNFTQLGLRVRFFKMMGPVNEHERLMCKVNSNVQSFVRARSMCTLYELGECLRELHPEKLEFEKLNLGPLQAMPVVFDFFKFPMDEYIPEITSVDIIGHLNEYLTSSDNWTNKVDLDDFLEYLVSAYEVTTPFSLGVRIRSVPLAIQALKKSKREAGQSRRGMLENLSQVLTADVHKSVQIFRDTILQPDTLELKLHYTQLQPLEAVKEIYGKFEVLSALMEDAGTPALQRKMEQFHRAFNSFRKSIESEPMSQQLFHLAVCLSVTDVHETAMEFLMQQAESKDDNQTEAASSKPEKEKPSQNIVAEKIAQYLNKYLQDGSLSLAQLKQIEKKVMEVFEVSSFDELGQGAFLGFLLSNPKLKEILEECGGAMFGSSTSSSAASGSASFHPSYTDLKELVCQAKYAGVTQAESTVCEQYRVKDVKALGHGNVARLHQAASQPGKHNSPHYNNCYEAALCGKACLPTVNTHSVGSLGNQSREKAKAVLTSCPLLEDLSAWSQWDLVFLPEHGALKDFISRHGGRQVLTISGGKQEAVSDFMALEIEPGKLLKISSESSATSFNEALERDDPVSAAGHLASLIAGSKGVELAPLALLANHVTTKLLSINAQQGANFSCRPSDFIDPKVECIVPMLMRLPIRICAAVANQVLLEPLSKVAGSAKSKQAVLQACTCSWQKDRLENLGILLGIPEWTVSLKDKMTFPPHLVCDVVVDELFGLPMEEEEEEEEERKKERLETSDNSDDDNDDDGDNDDDDDEEEECSRSISSDGEVEDSKVSENKEETETSEIQLTKRLSQKSLSEGEIEDSDDDQVEKPKKLSETDQRVVELESEKKVKCGDLRLEIEKLRKKAGEVKDSCSLEKAPVKKIEEELKRLRKKTEYGERSPEKESARQTEEEMKSAEMKDEATLKMEEEDAEGEEVGPSLTREDFCHLVVNTIRREEFGVGIELSEEASKLMKTQQERQGRSLTRLSKDLYSKDTHFVLELIQNADDNPYAKDTLPALKFIIDDHGVTIQNNELGFEEQNVRALCDVGKSTKSKHQMGYIGQKGIGFKSVFRVTDRPEVHSNGFHIYFDVNSGPMGYIMPHWNDAKRCDEKWMTQILLPWTAAIRDQIQTHAARFNDIQPSLLLFLHRLREVTIWNKVEGCQIHMSRKDFPTGEIQITHTHGIDRWLVVKKILDTSDVSLEAKSGADVQNTEIALAFPLRDKSNTLSYGARLGQLPVFAFLPLQSYGFRFIIQGDFNVPSSRESVDKHSPWNEWLRNKIPYLFIEAWESFRNLPDYSAMEAFIAYLQFIPLEGEIIDFFRPVTSHISTQLKAKDCMPVIGLSGDKDDILWKVPSKTVMTQSSLVREIISPRLLLHNLDLYYLHWDVLEMVEEGMLHALGVHTISTEHLLQIGQGVIANWDGGSGHTMTDQVTELAKWMACLYCSLDHFKDNTAILNTLRKLRIVPLSEGTLVSLEDTTVFLLTEGQKLEETTASRSRNRKNKTPFVDPLQPLRQDVNLIHPGLTSTQDAEVNSQVAKLLSLMDIKDMTPSDLIHSHVLPVLNSDQWKEKSENVLISYLVCAKQVLADDPDELKKLKDVARVVTNNGVKMPCQDNVHFPREFGNTIELERNFSKFPWTLLSTAYLPPSASPSEIESWHTFLSQLGVEDFLCVNKTQVCLDQTSLMNSPWAAYKELWQNFPAEFIIEDFSCEEFHSLVAMRNSVPFETMCHLYQLLETHWSALYKRFMITRVVSPSGKVLKENIDTSFGLDLKTLSWVPATWTTLASDTQLVRQLGLTKPNLLYCQTPEVQRLLAHTVKYLAVNSPNKSPFTQFLQVKSTVQKEAVKAALISWGQRAEGKPDTPAIFSTALEHILQVYHYLQQNFSAGEFQDLFHNHPVIFMAVSPDGGQALGPQGPRGGSVSGYMMKREDMWWSDQCGLFTKYKESLEKYNSPLARFRFMRPFYQGKESVFEYARIDQTHNMLHLAELLKHITSVFALEEEGVLQDILSLFSTIGTALSKADITAAGVSTQEAQVALALRPQVQGLLQDCAVFPTKGRKLVGVKDQPMLADIREWERMFEGKPLVHFLLLEDPNRRPSRHHAPNEMDQEMVRYFLDLFPDIKPLSDCVISEEITSGFKPCAKGQKYLHDIVSVLQQFIYFSFPEVYAEFKTTNAHHLKDMLFTEVDRLEVRYDLRDRPELFEIRTEICIVKDNHFYFLAKHIDNKAEINKEVARFFSNGDEECVREIRGFLSQAVPILEGTSDETFESLLSRQRTDIGNLPKEEEVWTIPLPTLPVRDPRPPAPAQDLPGFGGQPSSVFPFGPPPPSVGLSSQASEDGAQEGQGSASKSWPPRSAQDIVPGRATGAKKPLSKFVPPTAPDYIKASKTIPSNFHFENKPTKELQQEGNQGEKTAASGHGPDILFSRSASSTSTEDGRKERDGGGSSSNVPRDGDVYTNLSSSQGTGKRKLISESACSDGEGEGRLPASKRQSLEVNDDPVMMTTEGGKPESAKGDDVRFTNDQGGSAMGGGRRGSLHGIASHSVGREEPANLSNQDRSIRKANSSGQMLKFKIPLWSAQADSVAFTELTSDISKVKVARHLGEEAQALEVGRWGEQLVYDYLRQKQLTNPTIEDVIWANADEEKGMPYDFEMTFKTEDEGDAYSVFIEVKATRSDDKAVFEISSNQVEFAISQRERYHIFRVFGAGKDTLRLVKIDNIADRMKTKSVQLLMVI